MTGISDQPRRLLDQIDRIWRLADPVPADLITDALAAGALLGDVPEIPWLALTPVDAAPVRSGHDRTASFGNAELALDVEVCRTEGGGVTVAGVLAPTGRCRGVQVRWPSGLVTVAVDRAGYFRTGELPDGPLRLIVHRAGSLRPCATAWLRT